MGIIVINEGFFSLQTSEINPEDEKYLKYFVQLENVKRSLDMLTLKVDRLDKSQ